MAQNIKIAGATYSAVPAIDVPKATGGGTARYMDTSDANATAADILTGKTAYVGGVKVTGTGSGGGTDVYEVINRTTNVNVTDTNLSTVMARGIYAGTAAMAQGDTLTAGTIYVQYE